MKLSTMLWNIVAMSTRDINFKFSTSNKSQTFSSKNTNKFTEVCIYVVKNCKLFQNFRTKITSTIIIQSF